MNKQPTTKARIPRRSLLIGCGFIAAAVAPLPSTATNLKQRGNSTTAQFDENKNKKIIREGFAKWSNSTGNFFDLLADDVEWTITGSSPISKTYTSRKQFLEEAIAPLNERLSAKIVPYVRDIYADGDVVIALWDGTATARDGRPYNNTYSWYMTIKDGRIVKVVAFFDTIDLADLWKRIPVSELENT
jgi:uncharacterized protein